MGTYSMGQLIESYVLFVTVGSKCSHIFEAFSLRNPSTATQRSWTRTLARSLQAYERMLEIWSVSKRFGSISLKTCVKEPLFLLFPSKKKCELPRCRFHWITHGLWGWGSPQQQIPKRPQTHHPSSSQTKTISRFRAFADGDKRRRKLICTNHSMGF